MQLSCKHYYFVLASNFHPVPIIKTVFEVLLRIPGHMLR